VVRDTLALFALAGTSQELKRVGEREDKKIFEVISIFDWTSRNFCRK